MSDWYDLKIVFGADDDEDARKSALRAIETLVGKIILSVALVNERTGDHVQVP